MKGKILFILHIPPPVHGAAMVGQYIKESKLINENFECRYLNLGTSISVDEIGKGGFLKLKRYLILLWRTIFVLGGFKPDLVYLTLTAKGVGFYKDAVVAIIAKLFGKKIVYHFHNKGVSTRQKNWFDNVLYKIVFRNASVILLSKHLYYDIKKYVKIEKVHYCHNGIPGEAHFKEDVEADKMAPQLLFLSNLIISKGILVVLKACKILKNNNTSFTCLFIGGEGDMNAQEFNQEVRNLGLEKEVKYGGRKYGKDKAKVYKSSDIFLLPTFYENECFPLVLLEAMDFGLPVISTKEAGIPDILEDGITGFLIPKQNEITLAEKLEFLLKNEKLRETMGENGRKRFVANFTIEAFEKRFTNVMEEILVNE